MSADVEGLLQAARSARLRAHAPCSHFLVGAALETSEGVIVSGCNVENTTYGLTVCAERVALFYSLRFRWHCCPPPSSVMVTVTV